MMTTSRLSKMITMAGLKNRKRISSVVLLEAEPGTHSKKYGSVMGVLHHQNFYITIYGGWYFEVPNMASMLSNIFMMFYVLNISFPTSASMFFNFLGHLHGAQLPRITQPSLKTLLNKLSE